MLACDNVLAVGPPGRIGRELAGQRVEVTTSDQEQPAAQ